MSPLVTRAAQAASEQSCAAWLAGERPVSVCAGGEQLTASRAVPAGARAVVLIANDAGCCRDSPRVRAFAGALHEAGIATLMVDLLTPAEQAGDEAAKLRQGAVLLATRVAAARALLRRDPVLASLPLGCFGLGGAGAAVLIEAGACPGAARAVATFGARPDLAGVELARIGVPALLVAAEADPCAVRHNTLALAGLHGEKRLLLVPGPAARLDAPAVRDWLARTLASWFVARLLDAPAAAAGAAPGLKLESYMPVRI